MLPLAASAATSSAPTVTTQPWAVKAKSDSNTGAVVLSIIALVLAAGAVGLGAVNRALGSRRDA